MMALTTSPNPKPVYHAPNSVGNNRQRRSSGRKSFTSSALPPTMDSPRTLCPRDCDAFSYKPNHLPRWYIPQELWERLPHLLQSALTTMQHAGAAVLTGFERLEQLGGEIDLGSPEANTHEDELLAQLDDSIPSIPRLPLLPLRTSSNASSTLESSFCSSAVLSSPASNSASPSSLSASQTTSPISPICLTPADANFSSKKDRTSDRERSFSIPLEPQSAYYATELSQLRTESLPRLRHAARKIDTEFYEVKRANLLTSSDVNGFENWWADKKCAILSLDEKGKRLAHAKGITSNGMGWTAP